MARDRLCKVSWEAGEIECHVSKETEGQHVAAEFMLATGKFKIELSQDEEQEAREALKT